MMTSSCPECDGSVETSPNASEQYCTECGLVVGEDLIDRGPEWRAYNAEEHDERARAGAPTTGLMHDKGLSTVIDWKDQDAHGNSLSSRKKQQMQRLRTWNERYRTKTGQGRKLRQALGELQRISSCLELAVATRESASTIYRDAADEGLTQEYGYEPIVSAAIYAACRLDHIPRTLSDVAEASRVEEQGIRRAYSDVSQELGIEAPPPRPHTFVSQVATGLDAETETEMLALEFLKEYQAEDLHAGRRPKGLAGAALYAANLARGTPQHITESTAADAADVSEVTIRKRHREILEANGEDPRLASPGHHKEQSSWDRFAEGDA